jgi:hypothetical protein
MAQQLINIGAAADDGTGDTFRDAFDKTNDNFTELFSEVKPIREVVVNTMADLPAAVSGQIQLADQIKYVVGEDLNQGTDQFVLGADTVFSGLDENVVTVTYTGTGPQFTAIDKSCRLKGFTANCISGTFFNASNSAGNEGTSNVILDNVDVDCATLGSIANLNIFGMFRCAFNSISTDGWTYIGTQGNVVTINDVVILQQAGIFLDLGSATFLSFDIDNYLMLGSAGTTFLSGLTASGNIRTGGLGRVIRGRDFGAETILSGISVDDALWEFDLNDKIADTRADGLLSMQNNAVATIIAAPSSDGSSAVLVAGTWVVERASQMTGTTAGRLTYNGGKDATLPMTVSVSVEPASGTNINLSAYIAIGGVVVANSKRSSSASAGSPSSITIPWQEVFSTTNFFEVFVENNDNTTNILVSSAISRAN